MLGALLDAGRYDEGRQIFEGFVGTRSLRLLDNQIFLPAACALAEASARLGDAARAAVLHHALEPYAERLAVSGIGGISVGPVSRYAGLAAHAGGDLDAGERLLTAAIAQSVRHGMRAHEAHARDDLATLLVERGRPEDQTRAAAERQIGRDLADELGLVLRARPPA